MPDLSMRVTQAEFGAMVGIGQQAVSEFVKIAALGPDVTAHDMLLAYCARIREFAAGRGSDGELDLVQERAKLARAQWESQELKNAIQRKEYVPVAMLSDVLAAAAGSVAAKLDALPGIIKKMAPDMPDAARDAIAKEIASARNEWVESTADLAGRPETDQDEPEDDELVEDMG